MGVTGTNDKMSSVFPGGRTGGKFYNNYRNSEKEEQ